jgi:hypothetical protein
MTLNWEVRDNDGRFQAVASASRGSKYVIGWNERQYNEETGEWIAVSYRVEYRTAKDDIFGSVLGHRVSTLEQAKSLAEAHHRKAIGRDD